MKRQNNYKIKNDEILLYVDGGEPYRLDVLYEYLMERGHWSKRGHTSLSRSVRKNGKVTSEYLVHLILGITAGKVSYRDGDYKNLHPNNLIHLGLLSEIEKHAKCVIGNIGGNKVVLDAEDENWLYHPLIRVSKSGYVMVGKVMLVRRLLKVHGGLITYSDKNKLNCRKDNLIHKVRNG